MLDLIEKPKDRAPIMTIYGDAGLGKTSLGASLDNPIFIRIEDGLQSVPIAHRPDAFPISASSADVKSQIKSLATQEHKYRTLVIDSATALEELLADEVVASDNKNPKSINQALGGYGAGLAAVATRHMQIFKMCQRLNSEKGMTIVFLAHMETETVRPPDADDYTRHSLRMGKKSQAVYIDNSDLVGFIRLDVVQTEDKRMRSSGKRVLNVTTCPSNVSKNRLGYSKDLNIKLGANPFTAEVN